MSNIRDIVGNEAYDEFRKSITSLFPSDDFDEAGGTEFVDATIKELRNTDEELFRALKFNDVPEFDAQPQPLVPPDHAADSSLVCYYYGQAGHFRTSSTTPSGDDCFNLAHQAPSKEMRSGFHLPIGLVRVRLPLTEAELHQKPVVRSRLGDVLLVKDHICGSVEDLNTRFVHPTLGPGYLMAPAGKVELVTCPRGGPFNKRFAPISIYLGFPSVDSVRPSFYILESGTAGGDSVQLYFGPTFGEWSPEYCADFNPTLLSSCANRYTARLTLDDAGLHPHVLQIQAREPAKEEDLCPCREFQRSQEPKKVDCPQPAGPSPIAAHPTKPYIRIKLELTPKAEHEVIGPLLSPFQLFFQAAERAAAIGKVMVPGHLHSMPALVEELLASRGRRLVWDCLPTMGTECVQHPPAPAPNE